MIKLYLLTGGNLGNKDLYFFLITDLVWNKPWCSKHKV